MNSDIITSVLSVSVSESTIVALDFIFFGPETLPLPPTLPDLDVFKSSNSSTKANKSLNLKNRHFVYIGIKSHKYKFLK